MKTVRLSLFHRTGGRWLTQLIILPGIGGSDRTHWQTHWEATSPKARRFQPADWDRPDLEDWIEALDRAVAEAPEPPVLVAHSLACLLVAHWRGRTGLAVKGAFLVAVPDPSGPAFPVEAADFQPVPSDPLGFPSLIVASSDDPYGSVDHAKSRARQWGGEIVSVGARGHLNGQSGLGDWPEGRGLLTGFLRRIGSPE